MLHDYVSIIFYFSPQLIQSYLSSQQFYIMVFIVRLCYCLAAVWLYSYDKIILLPGFQQTILHAVISHIHQAMGK